MSLSHMAVEVFISCAQKDERYLQQLKNHLSVLERQGLISVWHHHLILPGTNSEKAIDEHINTASIIILLISADFIASDYCYSVEMKQALKRHGTNTARVIPVVVRPCNWQELPIGGLQPLPANARPINQWKSTDDAWQQVVTGLRGIIYDLLLLSTKLPWMIPYPHNSFFLGRDELLSQIHARFQGMIISQPQAISGLGGIGKTQIAVEYAYRFRQDYQEILWARAESTEALISSFIAIATFLQLPEREEKEQGLIVQSVKTWLQTHHGWLLILDNADELSLLPEFLPPSLGGHLLLTTRATAVGSLAHRLEIENLLPEQGALFLLRRAALLAPEAQLLQASPQEREQALQISQELGGLPLALAQAGAYLEATAMPLSSYQQIYQQHRAIMLQERRGLGVDHPESVTTTWSLSFHKVKQRNPAAAELLRLFAYFSPDAIAEEILMGDALQLGPVLATVVSDPLLFNQAIEALRAYSLIRRDPREKTFSIHRLVQAVLQDTLEKAERCLWAERAMSAVNLIFPDVEHATWLQCERVLSHALLSAKHIDEYQIQSPQAAHLLYRTAWYLKERARYIEAEPLYKQALQIVEQKLGREHLNVAYILNGLAELYRERGRYAEAEPLYHHALEIMEQQLGREHLDVAYPLVNQANLYVDQGKYTDAERLYWRALRIIERELEPAHALVAYPLNGLATLYYQQSKYREAEELYKKTLEIREQQLGPEHALVTYSLYGLANLYRELGKYAEAEPLYQRASSITEKQLGPEHPEGASSLNNLANLRTDEGRYTEAETLYQQALRIREQQLGLEHPLVAYPLNGLANLYRELHKYAEAEELYKRAVRIREQKLGSEHHLMAYPLNGLAKVYHEQGKYAEAEPLYQRALQLREQKLGFENPRAQLVRSNYVSLLTDMGKREEAEQVAMALVGSKATEAPCSSLHLHGLQKQWYST
ncbi:FxSxx-COOH system tetratricopeptide repeat protein [Ktedonospora formicarum]|uniref:Tetratricopeptide repeat protein n=1 Tax=Ktedonospora formicarum TaxID=2778364 RepID=A0A8J3MWX6_9CHLR|nr:FxSxx-COOH system tetratricopeptide repeat protein [Ktedonospora formicarum]GHO50830.1 tetratricopeptide repeat protein [Ktedonospora formicarum]